jgi:ribosomal protein L18
VRLVSDQRAYENGKVFARHAKTAGIEDAVDDRTAWAIGADTVEMWAGVFVRSDGLTKLDIGELLNVLACHRQKT